MYRRRGFTLIELLVVIAIIALLIGLLLPALAKAKRNAASLKDAAQLKEIHQSMLVYANDHDGWLPIPGQINRQPDPYLAAGEGDDGNRPGLGSEDVSKNLSRHLYSCMIAQNFFNTDICIGPTEVNPVISQYTEYRYDEYDPALDKYWDGDYKTLTVGNDEEGFLADISENGESHTSYYHMSLFGRRYVRKWRNNASNCDPLLASRGPAGGAREDEDDYKLSYTLQLHGSKKVWVGNVVYGDNHTEVAESFYPSCVSYTEAEEGVVSRDNIFAAEFTDYDDQGIASGDAYLAMTEKLTFGFPVVYTEGLAQSQ